MKNSVQEVVVEFQMLLGNSPAARGKFGLNGHKISATYLYFVVITCYFKMVNLSACLAIKENNLQ